MNKEKKQNSYPVPKPLFDTLENIDDVPECVKEYINSLSISAAEKEFRGVPFEKLQLVVRKGVYFLERIPGT